MAAATIAFSALRGGVTGNILGFVFRKVQPLTIPQATLFGLMQGVSLSILSHRVYNKAVISDRRYDITYFALAILSSLAINEVLRRRWEIKVPVVLKVYFIGSYEIQKEYV